MAGYRVWTDKGLITQRMREPIGTLEAAKDIASEYVIKTNAKTATVTLADDSSVTVATFRKSEEDFPGDDL